MRTSFPVPIKVLCPRPLSFDNEILTHRYLWGPQVDQQIADEHVADGEVIWALTDHLGTARDLVKTSLVNQETVVLKHRRYDAFGNIIEETNRGDFNNDTYLDEQDLDILLDAIYQGFKPSDYYEEFDIDGNEIVDAQDVKAMILDVIETVFGDADLSGMVSAGDLDIVLGAWGVTDGDAHYWMDGDFDGDGMAGAYELDAVLNNWGASATNMNTEVLEYAFGFTGRLYDEATGLQNNLNRWYDPSAGRWISEDPIGFAAGDANLSRYVGNSTTNSIDPNGLEGEFVSHWHHLYSQGVFTDKFLNDRGLKLDVHDTRNGWMLTAKDHTLKGGVHAPCDGVEWNQMWKDQIKKWDNAGKEITNRMLARQKTRMMKHFGLIDSQGKRRIGFAAQMTYQNWGNQEVRSRILKKLGKASNFAKYVGKNAIPLVGGLWVFSQTGDYNAAGLEIAADLSGMDIPLMGGRGLAALSDQLQGWVDQSVANSPNFNQCRGQQDRHTTTNMRGIKNITPDGRFLD